jgi:hypothetical protein
MPQRKRVANGSSATKRSRLGLRLKYQKRRRCGLTLFLELVSHQADCIVNPMLTAASSSGKSVLASVIIDEIRQKKLGLVAFFYCKHRNPDQSTFISVMRAILSQFLAQQRHLVPFYHDEGIESGEVPLQSIKLCKKLLRYMLQNIPNGFLVIDGLDECDVSERKSLLDFLNEIVSLCDSTNPGKIRILILSRDEPDIKRYLSTGMVVRIDSRDTLQDIELYVRHRASLVQRKFDLTAEDREYIEQNVLDRTQGNGNPPSPEATLIW